MFEKLSILSVWIDGLLYKLFNNLGIKGRMWLAIKDLYTDVKAEVLYSGELSRRFDVSQGTGQGRIFPPFMYKVYINSLLQKLSNHCYAISIKCTFQILGDCQGRRTGVGVTTVSNSLILGGWVTKVSKNGDKKEWGGRVGDNNIQTSSSYCT